MHAVLAQPEPPAAHLEWLEATYREHSRTVLRAAYRVTGSASDAEDVLQTVFLRLVRRETLPNLSGGAAPYLRRAAVNAAIDLVESRRARRSDPLDTVPPAATRDRTAGPDRRHLARELGRELRRAVATLGGRSAEMFVLRYFEDLDNRDIAEMYDTSPGTVAVTLHRARTQLKAALGSYLGDAS